MNFNTIFGLIYNVRYESDIEIEYDSLYVKIENVIAWLFVQLADKFSEKHSSDKKRCDGSGGKAAWD